MKAIDVLTKNVNRKLEIKFPAENVRLPRRTIIAMLYSDVIAHEMAVLAAAYYGELIHRYEDYAKNGRKCPDPWMPNSSTINCTCGRSFHITDFTERRYDHSKTRRFPHGKIFNHRKRSLKF